MIFAFQLLGHLDIFDIWLEVECGKNRGGEGVPSVGLTAAEVKQAVRSRRAGEVNGHSHGVFHIEEIAHLIAVGVVGVVALEQADLASGLDLLVGLCDEAAHVVFVGLIGAEHIVILEADDFFVPTHTLSVAIKHMLGVAIHVERGE